MSALSAEGLVTVLTQFGAAGLIGVLWVLERRAGQQRDRQLNEAHEKLMSRERELDALLHVVKDNTAAIKALEYTQRRLIELLKARSPSDSANAA